jgi:uncharacterized protein YkwD
MLPWIAQFRNALLLVGIAASFALASLAFALLDDPPTAASPSERFALSTGAASAVDSLRLDRLVAAAPPLKPTRKQILESATVLAQAELIAPPVRALMSSAAPAAVLPPTAVAQAAPVVMHQPSSAHASPVASLPASPPSVPSPAEVRPAAAQLTSGTSDARLDTAFAQHAFAAVNALRSTAGLAPLQVDGALASAAQAYALDLAEARWFSHTGPDGSTMRERLHAAGVVNIAAGEVLAMGSGGWTPDAVAQSWLDSPPHRAIILGAFSRAGIACAFSQEDGSPVVRCVMELAA